MTYSYYSDIFDKIDMSLFPLISKFSTVEEAEEVCDDLYGGPYKSFVITEYTTDNGEVVNVAELSRELDNFYVTVLNVKVEIGMEALSTFTLPDKLFVDKLPKCSDERKKYLNKMKELGEEAFRKNWIKDRANRLCGGSVNNIHEPEDIPVPELEIAYVEVDKKSKLFKLFDWSETDDFFDRFMDCFFTIGSVCLVYGVWGYVYRLIFS